MKFYVIQSKKRNWTNKAAREALNVETGSTVRITSGDNSVNLTLNRAPASAARVMRAVQAMTGLFGIAVDRYAMQQLKAKPGDTVQVVNGSIATVQRTSTNKPTRQVELVGGKKLTLKDRIKGLKIGEEMEVSESAAKSGAYSAAKEVGVKIMRLSGTNVIKRVS